MNTMQGSTLASLHAAEAFLDAHAGVLGDVINTGTRRKLANVIAELTGHASDQFGSQKQAQGVTLGTDRLRTALTRDQMTPIARIARAELAQTPQIHPLRMRADGRRSRSWSRTPKAWRKPRHCTRPCSWITAFPPTSSTV